MAWCDFKWGTWDIPWKDTASLWAHAGRCTAPAIAVSPLVPELSASESPRSPESVFSVLDKQNLLSHGGYVPAVIGPFSIHGFHPHLPSAQGSRKWNPLKPSAFAFATLQRGRCTSGSTSFGPPSSWPAKEQIEMPVVRGIILAIPRNPWYDRGKACRFRPHLRV